MSSAAVVGTGFSAITRRSERPLIELVLQACDAALHDAGLTWDDVDGIASYPSTAGSGGSIEGIDTVGVEFLAQTRGLRELTWYGSLERGTIGHVLAGTVNAVQSGAAKVAVMWKAMHTPKGKYGAFRVDRAPGESQFRAPYGMGGPYNAGGGAVGEFALPYSQYLARHGRDRIEMGHHIVRNRANAARNPDAIFAGKPLSWEEWTASPMVSDPLSVLDCDMAVDGAGAVVVATEGIARSLGKPVAWVTGQASAGIHFMRAPSMIWDDLVFNAERLTSLALERSGVALSAITAAALYDGFSYMIPLWLESAGFCAQGEAFDFLAAGETGSGRRVEVNALGGNLGMGRLHGIPQVVEAARQVRKAAPPGTAGGHAHALLTVGNATHGAAAFVFSAEPRND